jgi:hypothetical protein
VKASGICRRLKHRRHNNFCSGYRDCIGLLVVYETFNILAVYIVNITMRPQRDSEEIDDLWQAVDDAILEEFSHPAPTPTLTHLSKQAKKKR